MFGVKYNLQYVVQSLVYLSQFTDTDSTATENTLQPEPSQKAPLRPFIGRYKLQQFLKT